MKHEMSNMKVYMTFKSIIVETVIVPPQQMLISFVLGELVS